MGLCVHKGVLAMEHIPCLLGNSPQAEPGPPGVWVSAEAGGAGVAMIRVNVGTGSR